MRNAVKLPPQEELRRLYYYSPVTGELWTTEHHLRPHTQVRTQACNANVTRVIWKWVTGEDPGENVIDHINRDTTCNGWHNLRLLTHGENQINTQKRKGASRVRGVSFHKGEGKWCVDKHHKGRRYWLGYYNTEAEACQAALTWEENTRPGLVPVEEVSQDP